MFEMTRVSCAALADGDIGRSNNRAHVAAEETRDQNFMKPVKTYFHTRRLHACIRDSPLCAAVFVCGDPGSFPTRLTSLSNASV